MTVSKAKVMDATRPISRLKSRVDTQVTNHTTYGTQCDIIVFASVGIRRLNIIVDIIVAFKGILLTRSILLLLHSVTMSAYCLNIPFRFTKTIDARTA